MHRRNDGDRHAGPDHRHLLPLVGGARTVGARRQQRVWILTDHRPQTRYVNPCAKPLARARNHADPRIRRRDFFACGDDRVDHRIIHRIHLVGSGQPNVSNVRIKGD